MKTTSFRFQQMRWRRRRQQLLSIRNAKVSVSPSKSPSIDLPPAQFSSPVAPAMAAFRDSDGMLSVLGWMKMVILQMSSLTRSCQRNAQLLKSITGHCQGFKQNIAPGRQRWVTKHVVLMARFNLAWNCKVGWSGCKGFSFRKLLVNPKLVVELVSKSCMLT